MELDDLIAVSGERAGARAPGTALPALVKPLNVRYAKSSRLRSRVSAGNVNPAQFASSDGEVHSFEQQASPNGWPIVASAVASATGQ